MIFEEYIEFKDFFKEITKLIKKRNLFLVLHTILKQVVTLFNLLKQLLVLDLENLIHLSSFFYLSFTSLQLSRFYCLLSLPLSPSPFCSYISPILLPSLIRSSPNKNGIALASTLSSINFYIIYFFYYITIININFRRFISYFFYY